MLNPCKANPCCGDPYECKVPLPQGPSGLTHLNDTPSKTLVADLADRAVAMMTRGAGLQLRGIDDDPAMMSALFSGDVSQEIARRLGLNAVHDRLLPDSEDYRNGYSTGYADAYGDVSDLKAKLDERKRAIAILNAQNEWLKDRLSNLQLSPRDPRNIEEWLVECGMPIGESCVERVVWGEPVIAESIASAKRLNELKEDDA